MSDFIAVMICLQLVAVVVALAGITKELASIRKALEKK